MPEWQRMIAPIASPSGLALFLHILWLLIYPIILVIVLRASWYTLLSRVFWDWKDRDMRITLPVDVSVGLLVFSIGLLILASIGLYTLTWLIVLIVLMGGISYTGIYKTYRDSIDIRATYEFHTRERWLLGLISPRLLTAEFGFFILTLFVSVSMISIIRPMPIGWDDLGVYMNHPKILALTGELLPWAGMYVWQLITGTGFLFGYNAAQAFYINQIASILAVAAIGLWLSWILDKKWEKSILSLPLLLGTVYFVMPMTVFHHTKDMKLDPALLFVSISVFMLFYAYVKDGFFKQEKDTKKTLMLIWILMGFAFSIKVTTLMLILWVLGLLAYRMLSFWGYIWFFSLFLAIFTWGHLWSIMNVWMPSDSSITNSIVIGLWVIGILSFAIAFWQRWRDILTRYIVASIILVVSFFVGFSPWIVKNTIEVQPWAVLSAGEQSGKQVLLQSLLSGSGAWFSVDFTEIMPIAEYEERKNIIQNSNISAEWQSQNEDFWRYFGYEEGINNYLRLPFNLTFQKNQWWEFTAITYIFLALIPPLFLFARWRREYLYKWIISVVLALLFAYSFMWTVPGNDGKDKYPIESMLSDTYAKIVENEQLRADGGDLWTHIATYTSDIWLLLVQKPILELLYTIQPWDTLAQIFSLPIDVEYPLLYGYLILVVLNIIFFATVHFLTQDETEEDRKLRDTVAMLTIYGFIFLISAFGIVWYGILVYFIFFILIGLLSAWFWRYNTQDEKSEKSMTIKWVFSVFIIAVIGIYFIKTAIPHAWTNLKSAGFNEYKYNILDQETTLFLYRSDYLVPIASMNLTDLSILHDVSDRVSSTRLKQVLEELSKEDPVRYAEALGILIPQLLSSKETWLRRDWKAMAEYVYNTILYPNKEQSNEGGIYRIGTFMTYLINKNIQRYFDDSLIFGFDGYFYEENHERTIEKMNRLGFKFLLIDLNAATIDRDPRRALTQRYEHLLLTMRAKNLKLISTDNVCLRFALDEYRSGKYQDARGFLDIAWTNYESYGTTASGESTMTGRWTKQAQCYNAIINAIYQDNAAEKYPYLQPLKDAIDKNNALQNQDMLSRLMMSFAGQSFFALYEIIDIPVSSPWSQPVDDKLTLE